MKTTYNFKNIISGMLALFLIWWAASLFTQITVIVSPIKVIFKLFHILYPTLLIHGAYSLGRIVVGVIGAVCIGLPISIGMGYFPLLDKLFSPIVYMTYPIPKIALLPIVMVLCGLGEISKITMIILIIVFQVIVAIRDGVKNISKEVYEPLLSAGATHRDNIIEIVIPACLPKLFTSLRIGMATAISVLFFTETFGTTYGMGFFIMDAWMRVNYLEMYAGIVFLSFMGLTLFFILDMLERRFCRWIK